MDRFENMLTFCLNDSEKPLPYIPGSVLHSYMQFFPFITKQSTYGCILLMDGWITCHFTSCLKVFQSYQDKVNNARLCAMELRLPLRRFRHE